MTVYINMIQTIVSEERLTQKDVQFRIFLLQVTYRYMIQTIIGEEGYMTVST
jgi:hypothetical protein